MAGSNDLTLAFTGNCSIFNPVSPYRDEGFLKVVDLLREADVSFTNMECTIYDGHDWPSFGSGMGWAGSYLGVPPLIVDELRWLGIDAVFAANNHIADFAEGGILTTIKYLEDGKIAYAGIGTNLTTASEPAYVETPHGRVAFISVSDWGPRAKMDLPFPWPAGYMPSDEGPHFPSRPGVNLLRYDAAYHVDRDVFDQIQRMGGVFEWDRAKAGRRGAWAGQRTEPLFAPTWLDWEVDSETEYFCMGRKFILDSEFRISTFAYQEDVDRICKHIRDARRLADIVVVALHDQSHGVGVLDYIDTCAHQAVDAGADVFINTGGKHRGIEIYKGKAIFYGQPTFFLQNQQVAHVPQSVMQRVGLGPDSTGVDFVQFRAEGEMRGMSSGAAPHEIGDGPDPARRWWKKSEGSVVHLAVFGEDAQLEEVRIYPLDAKGGPIFRHGLPQLAPVGSEVSKRVLERVNEECKPFGTSIDIRDGVGVLKVR
jgi:poly-gamma-glutamate capsule biosynthesis protein CapA/YwtB (metallophosphatase superfamily)